jgi:DNA-binding MarR family transcriptional regulator
MEKMTGLRLQTLIYLRKHPDSRITEIAESIGVHRTSVSRSIRMLEKNGWVKQGREHYYEWEITDSGERQIGIIRKDMIDKVETLRSRIGYIMKILDYKAE